MKMSEEWKIGKITLAHDSSSMFETWNVGIQRIVQTFFDIKTNLFLKFMLQCCGTVAFDFIEFSYYQF